MHHLPLWVYVYAHIEKCNILNLVSQVYVPSNSEILKCFWKKEYNVLSETNQILSLQFNTRDLF